VRDWTELYLVIERSERAVGLRRGTSAPAPLVARWRTTANRFRNHLFHTPSLLVTIADVRTWLVGAAIGAMMALGLVSACVGRPAASVPSMATVPVDAGPLPAANEFATTSSGSSTPSKSPDSGAHSAGKCSGTGSRELWLSLAVRANRTRACYNHALRDDRTLTGKMRVLLRIEEDGSVSEGHVVASDMPPEMSECVLRTFEQEADYPGVTGGCVEAGIPLNFIPTKPTDAGAPAPPGK
jgi:hypothetical protein